jgi:hypothetical protein
MTAPDQCCINVKKLLSIRRRPHMTQSGHRLDLNPAAQQPPWCQLRSMVENRFAFLTVSHQFDILRLRPLMLGLD